jgi:hypothetical protein
MRKCDRPGCDRQQTDFSLRCCSGCLNPSLDGVVVHTDQCNSSARSAKLPTCCPTCGRPSQGHPGTDVGAHCCDTCYKNRNVKDIWAPRHSHSCGAITRTSRPAEPLLAYKPEKRREAIICISQERVRALLDIPRHWKIIDVKFDSFRGGDIEILFSGDDLYPIAPGCSAPCISATYNLPDPTPAPYDVRVGCEYSEGNPT